VSVPPPPFGSLGEFIRSQRELMSLSLRQLAESAKVSNPYLSQIERGVYTPSAQVLKGIADALDISAETLFQQAGLLDNAFERPATSVEDAIRMDTQLTKEGKQALIQVYRGLVGTREKAPEHPTARRSRAATEPIKTERRPKPRRR
jgi:transcriptional regulator with XRE-family HTH domain